KARGCVLVGGVSCRAAVVRAGCEQRSNDRGSVGQSQDRGYLSPDWPGAYRARRGQKASARPAAAFALEDCETQRLKFVGSNSPCSVSAVELQKPVSPYQLRL